MTSPQHPEPELRLNPPDADRGGVFPLEIPASVPCPRCSAGAHPGRRSTVCPRCEGQLILPIASGGSGLPGGCATCHGDGWIAADECDQCHGSALSTATRTIRVRVPAGITSGQRIRLAGHGVATGPGAPAGDLYVTVRVDISSGIPVPRVGADGGSSSPQKQESKAAKMKKVAKLLRKADAVAGTPEQAVYLDRAFALIAEYGLEEAMVRAAMGENTDSDEADEAASKVVERVFIVTSVYGSHQILTFMGNALHCKAVHWKSGKTGCPKDTVRVALFGVSDHIERVHFLWDLLEPQALRALELLPENDSWYSPESVYRRSWVVGFAIGIADRLREHEEKAVAKAESGTALVLYDLFKRDAERAEAVVRERWPELEAQEPSDAFDPCGIEDGKRAARSAELNRSVGAKAGSLIRA